MRFQATEDKVKLSGRTLFVEGTRYLGYSGSSITFTFVGKKASAFLWTDGENWGEELKGYLAVYVDGGEEPVRRIRLEKTGVYSLYEGSGEKRTTVKIEKYSEAAFTKCGVRYLEIDTEELCAPPAGKERRLEIIGDSITCGYGVEAENELQPFRTDTENPEKSYSLLTAKALDAEVNLVSWSGNGIISGYVEETAQAPSDKWLMPEVYRYTDIACSAALFGEDERKWEKWDFSRFVPDAVLINLGTNDCSWCKDIRERKDGYKRRYGEFLEYIRKHNPEAQIFCMLGTMDQRLLKELEEAVEDFCGKQGDGKVHFLSLPPQEEADGYGADWHPSALTQRKTARIVAAEVRKVLDWSC